MSDLISRQAAIDRAVSIPMFGRDVKMVAVSEIKNLSSAQPEIVRCKDCAKREYCRTSTVWAVAPDDDWFCADAERRTDE